MKNYTYPIDLSWSTDEITSVLHFFSKIEAAYETRVDTTELLVAYDHFKQIVPGKAQEKQLDREFEKLSGYSTYQAVKKAKELGKGWLSLGK
ncbi:UPF0223 family protein [Streptococcus cuniculipharyngis]|uniref:UPF0223 protein FRX57_01990 n=1 Tax=Streptococcus cuniculipharyngis TaxID=1562651 RepID=A0A5C5SDG1_9STRE|nr:UPF0223 family protein [Streptococcus cuniculipharyngis]TWS98996.1 UPF0223 family protein [Streptococcus cuniculipharyngis]